MRLLLDATATAPEHALLFREFERTQDPRRPIGAYLQYLSQVQRPSFERLATVSV